MDPISLSNAQAAPAEWFHVGGPPETAEVDPKIPPYFDTSALQGSSMMANVQGIVNEAGGVSNPMALLSAQTKLIEIEMSWLFTSQVASKVTSGMQTLFNNQV